MPDTRPRILVRNARPEDTAGIASLLAAAFAEFVNLYTPAGYAATTPPALQVRQRMNEGPTWIAVLDECIVGTVSAVQKNDNSLYIRGMAVLPSARGQHIGESLLNAVVNFARSQGSRRLFLSTTPFLTAAIKLYERSGFTRSAEGPYELFGTPLFTMSKELELTKESVSHT